jgi:hypothetical protein
MESISKASLVRRQLASELLAGAPDWLGEEIAVTGSVSRGIASAHSDIEINFWGSEIEVSPNRRAVWLSQVVAHWLTARKNVEHVVIDRTPIADGSVWLVCAYHGTWIEMAFQSLQVQETLLTGLLQGDIAGHDIIVGLEAILHSFPLRSSGALEKWKRQLSWYPGDVQVRLVLDAAEAWTFPLHLDATWNVSQEYRLKFLEYLHGDLQRVLRIVFACNGVWEPDWKNLSRRVDRMQDCPPKLLRRISAILTSPDLRVSRRACYELVLDALAVVPPHIDVSSSVGAICNSLLRHD